MSFRSRVLNIVKKIPTGETLSYAEVAKQAGNPQAYREEILISNLEAFLQCKFIDLLL